MSKTSHSSVLDDDLKIDSSIELTEILNKPAKKLRILLVGDGGRESAIAWKLSQSSKVEHIYVVPGNGGTAFLPKTTNISSVQMDDYPGLVILAKSFGVDLIVPGPELPIVEGIEGYFREAGIFCFGPCKEAARLEGSKAYAKDFMKKYDIPTADYCTFDNYSDAETYLMKVKHNVVIKASGLAAGKGVLLPKTKEDAIYALQKIMLGRIYGDAGDEVVIEELLHGEEISILTFSDGKTCKSLVPAQDYKRMFEGDQGPNTGGMGCYAPAKVVSDEQLEYIGSEILSPTFRGLQKQGTPFVGVLFTGIMLTKSGPKVLEYNVRFGDPEAQTLIPLLAEDTDLAEIMMACVKGDLKSFPIAMEQKSSVVVCLVSSGYPGTYKTGFQIGINEFPIENPGKLQLFHAGTSYRDGNVLRTSGGRVIAVSATADTLEEAVKLAYEGVETIYFEGMYYRKDIARRALENGSAAQLKM